MRVAFCTFIQPPKNIANLTAEQNETICKLLRGLNFRQISAVIDKDELIVAKILYSSITDKTIILRPPKTPFDQLPKIPIANSADKIKNWQLEESKIYSCHENVDGFSSQNL